jgi:hypothetical protein
MATANIALNFTSKTPTLDEVLVALKEIKKIASEKINIKINATETAKATKQTTEELKEQAKILKDVKDNVVIAEKAYQRQAITNRQLQKEYGNAINMLREMGSQEKLIETYKTKIWVTEKNITTEIQRQQVASDTLHKKIADNLNNQLNMRQRITKEVTKLSDMDRLHAQASKINTRIDTQKATGYIPQTPQSGIGMNGMFDLYLLRQGINVINSAFQPLVDYEQAIYNLGVVAEKTQPEIKGLFDQFQQLSTEIPVSATSLVKATDEIARVGLVYEDALAVATQGAKLAIASGDKIEGVTNSLAKVLVGLEMFGRTTQEVAKLTDQMHSVLLKTPLSTQTLSEGLRHATSAMAVFIQNSTKSGKTLEDYKDTLLQTTLALEGGFARLGKLSAPYISNSIRKLRISGKLFRALTTKHQRNQSVA